ncbi:TetR/AcrR family transcriptional regulator [Paramicrobacterium chengjingii]|uniref:TetR/AcrR family transcriptional regulator n=1 Tax=Paramicrobacterium chengjingii TaxID=2769067 RepID=UPI001423F373|nr:TetR/AcrR family transcriptional regulator [Microbacterium chengjingii]
MESGRGRLIEAARVLLAEQPGRVPSTRELCEAAGVGAPTLYHHFGDKDGLLQAVTEQAFADYLERKRAVPRTGDLLADFAAGWNMHVGFGVTNPALYELMYSRADRQQFRAAQTAEAELRRGLERLADAGLLRIGVDDATALTTAMAIGCVTRLIHDGGSADGPLAETMRAALMLQLTGQRQQLDPIDDAAAQLLARLGSAPGLFTAAEEALLRQWLRTLTENATPQQDEAEHGANR